MAKRIKQNSLPFSQLYHFPNIYLRDLHPTNRIDLETIMLFLLGSWCQPSTTLRRPSRDIEQDAYPKQAKIVPEVGVINIKLRDKLIPSGENASGSNRRTRVQQFPSRFNRRLCSGSAKRPMNSSNVMPIGGMVWRDSVSVQVMFALDSRGHGAAD
ncbi:hypothetical protein I7I51_03045 [Histoplasma capsulatum]|uniref:Uncharacterized protein n=1 Tax=Ajellomyces capsulatus TaxID=5037 RepID=A0A8A1MQF8_AJECA|nr:hypothetical protein I7I51_03045 [Histoplasma capsulatum]